MQDNKEGCIIWDGQWNANKTRISTYQRGYRTGGGVFIGYSAPVLANHELRG